MTKFETGFFERPSATLYEMSDLVIEQIVGVDPYIGMDDIGDYISTKKLFKPTKTTVLHDFIVGVLDLYTDYSTGHQMGDESVQEWGRYLRSVHIQPPSFINDPGKWTNSRSQIRKTDTLMMSANRKLCPGIFHLIFSDRHLCLEFQRAIAANAVFNLKQEDYPEDLADDGLILRPIYLPVWLKQGVFYRDMGICQLCCTDLSGLLIPMKERHLDHIIPLAKGGTNDPTNFQLTCKGCNLSKAASLKSIPARTPRYW